MGQLELYLRQPLINILPLPETKMTVISNTALPDPPVPIHSPNPTQSTIFLIVELYVAEVELQVVHNLFDVLNMCCHFRILCKFLDHFLVFG